MSQESRKHRNTGKRAAGDREMAGQSSRHPGMKAALRGRGCPLRHPFPQRCSPARTLTLKDIVHVNPVLVITQLANEVIKDRALQALRTHNSPEPRAAACDNGAVPPY